MYKRALQNNMGLDNNYLASKSWHSSCLSFASLVITGVITNHVTLLLSNFFWILRISYIIITFKSFLQGVVVYIFMYFSTGEAKTGRWIFEVETSLAYRVNSRIASATQSNPVLKQPPSTHKITSASFYFLSHS